jgi:hypothetical protein
MALIEDALKGNTAGGLADSLGTVVLVPLLLPAIGWVVRPVAKVAVQTGVEIYRGAVALIGAAMPGELGFGREEVQARTESGGPGGESIRPEGDARRTLPMARRPRRSRTPSDRKTR